MKKGFFLLVSLLLLMGLLSACGSGTPATSSDGTPADIQAIKDRGVLKVGVKADVPKFGFKDPKTEQIDGFEVDIARAIAKKILGDPTKVELQAVTAKTRGPLLDNGDVDLVAATFTITEERKKSYNFSDSYYTDSVGLMVKKDSGITGLKDMDGKTIGVAQSATSRKAIQAEADKLGIKVNFLEYATYPEINTALEAGRVQAFSVDRSILAGYLNDTKVILEDKFSPQDYGVASKKGNDGLAKTVNETISEMKKSGELDQLVKKWGLQ